MTKLGGCRTAFMAFKIPTDRDKQDWAEAKQSWQALLIYAVLSASWLVVQELSGRGWSVIAAVLAVAVWFIFRPWQLGTLPASRKRNMCFAGGVMLCGWAVVAALNYWSR